MMPVNNLDLARIYSAGEQIKGMKNQNALAEMDMKNRQRFNALAGDIAAGDRAATIEGLTVNPQGTGQIVQTIASMNESQRAVARQNIEDIAKVLLTVEKAPPEQRPALWQQARQTAQGWGLDLRDVPMEYDPQYAKLAASRLMEMDQLLGSTKPMSGPGKVQHDIDAGFLPPETPLRGAGVTVNLPGEPKIGTIPPGYEAVQDPATKAWSMRPITGGPAAQEIAAKAEAKKTQEQQKVIQAGVVTEDIDRALAMVSDAKIPITGMGSILSAVPGTKAHDLAATLDTIKANIGFDKLQAMRAASPTGGALGQVSENENKLLQSVWGALQQSQSEEEFTYNLRRLRDTYLDVVHGPGNRPGSSQPTPQGKGDGGAKAADYPDGTTATNAVGQKMIVKGGKWVPMQ